MTGRDWSVNPLGWRQVEILSAVMQGIPLRRSGAGYVAESATGFVVVDSVAVDGLVSGGLLSVESDGSLAITSAGGNTFQQYMESTIASARGTIRALSEQPFGQVNADAKEVDPGTTKD